VKLSHRALRMEPSATLAVAGKAKALAAQGKSVISFGAGEPDFASPPSALTAAQEAMAQGKTHYTASSGIPELKKAVAAYYQERFGLTYAPKQILVGAGAKPLLYEALGCLVNPGDEVIIPAPAWVSYLEQVNLFEGKPVVVETAPSGYLPTLEALEKAVTPRTVGLLLNSPCNPTGQVYGEELLRGIGELAERHNLWIIWDEIYERLVYGDARHINPLELLPHLAPRVLLVNGVSKAFAMTGWRIGYALGPEALITKMDEFQGHLTSNACSVAQWASLGALQGAEADVVRMHQAFASRRELMMSRLRSMPHISFPEPRGAFYVLVDLRSCLGLQSATRRLDDDSAFCEALLEEELVAAVPGSAFLAPGHLRLSYANATEEITEGMNRLERFLKSLK